MFCGKTPFASKGAAIRALKKHYRINPKQYQHPYFDGHCRHWHLTSSEMHRRPDRAMRSGILRKRRDRKAIVTEE